jgi:uncharacterized membrane protein
MNQTKKQSAVEVCIGTAIGIIGSWAITMAVLHQIDDRTLAGTVTVLLCTIWSLIRGYAIRRHFNGIQNEQEH